MMNGGVLGGSWEVFGAVLQLEVLGGVLEVLWVGGGGGG